MSDKIKIEKIKRLHELSREFSLTKMSEDKRTEFNSLNKEFLGIDLVGTLLTHIDELEFNIDAGGEYIKALEQKYDDLKEKADKLRDALEKNVSEWEEIAEGYSHMVAWQVGRKALQEYDQRGEDE